MKFKLTFWKDLCLYTDDGQGKQQLVSEVMWLVTAL